VRKLIIAVSAVAMAVPTITIPTSAADAAQYRSWRGKDGRIYCRRPNGTTGLLIGGAGGALLGREVQRSQTRERCVSRSRR
jgi:hypothetical protein